MPLLSDVEVDKIVAENQATIDDIQWLGSLKKNMEAYEKYMIIKAIKTHKNLVSAASYLGISRQSLNQKINNYIITSIPLFWKSNCCCLSITANVVSILN